MDAGFRSTNSRPGRTANRKRRFTRAKYSQREVIPRTHEPQTPLHRFENPYVAPGRDGSTRSHRDSSRARSLHRGASLREPCSSTNVSQFTLRSRTMYTQRTKSNEIIFLANSLETRAAKEYTFNPFASLVCLG